MAKLLVKTTGSFQLLDPLNGQEVKHDRPSVVVDSPFIQQRIGARQLTVEKGDLPDSMTDEKFEAEWKAKKAKEAEAKK